MWLAEELDWKGLMPEGTISKKKCIMKFILCYVLFERFKNVLNDTVCCGYE